MTAKLNYQMDTAGMIQLEVFKTVFSALKLRQTVRSEYRSLEQSGYTFRMADPYHAVSQGGNWYFIGFCHERQEPRLFSFSQMKKVKLTKKSFDIPPDFKPEIYCDKEMGVWASSRTPYTVELLIDKKINTYTLDRHWHSTRRFSPTMTAQCM